MISLLLILITNNAWARPEYALRNGYVSCMMCHASPSGAGPKSVNGKLYASHGNSPGLFSNEERVSGDFRILMNYPNRPSTTSNGTVVMAAVPSINLPVYRSDALEGRVVGATSLGFLANGIRELFVQVKPSPNESFQWVDSVIFGRFLVPFGLMTDEHRSFARIQTVTDYNHFEMGLLASGTPSRFVHYDLGLTTGMQNGGASFVTNDLTYALIGNVRTDLQALPLSLGLSGALHQTSTLSYMPYAASVSAGFSLERLLKLRWAKVDLLSELSIGRGWNNPATNSPGLGKFFSATDAAYQAGVLNSTSLGVTLLSNYYLFEWLSLLYKFEELALDYRYLGDAYYRHGFGVKYFVTSFFNVQARYEIQFTGRPGITETDATFARNTFYTLFNIVF